MNYNENLQSFSNLGVRQPPNPLRLHHWPSDLDNRVSVTSRLGQWPLTRRPQGDIRIFRRLPPQPVR